jgi:hypothetical protein
MRCLAILILVAACAHKSPPVGNLRFKVQDPVWRVNDRVPLAKQPNEREYNRTLYHADGFVFRRTTRAMEMRNDQRAQDVNALDEVPDSTWFTNRIGVRDLSIEELRRGPNVTASPFDHRPWKITGAKIGGLSLGFTFEDTRGDKYLLKFDKASAPEMETGAHAIVLRILWAIGYNVPEDHIGYIRAEDLLVGDKANKKGLTPEQLAAIVDEARYTDPRAAKYMLEILIARQRKTARYWFDRVAPLDAFSIDSDVNGARLCFTDLLFAYQLRGPKSLYKVDAFDAAGKRIGKERALGAMPNGRTCVNGVTLAADYTIVRLRVQRNDRDLPPVLVHVARDANGLRIIGLRRR